MSEFERMLKHVQKQKVNEAHDWRAQGANPCPFCGSDDITMEAPEVTPGDPKTFVAVCGSCGAQGSYKDTEQAAVDVWNKVAKAAPSAPAKESKSKVNEENNKMWTVSLTLSIEAPTEEKAKEEFDERLQFGKYEGENIEAEEEIIESKKQSTVKEK